MGRAHGYRQSNLARALRDCNPGARANAGIIRTRETMATTAYAPALKGAGKSNPITIGVLALQGDYEAHARAFESAGAQTVLVRKAAELAGLDGLVMPGGESTTMLKFLEQNGFL